MKRYAVKLTLIKGFVSGVKWLYISPSGSYYKDVDDYKDATLLYSEESAEEWCEKIRKNRAIGSFLTEIVEVRT